jgi:hypothetical protein
MIFCILMHAIYNINNSIDDLMPIFLTVKAIPNILRQAREHLLSNERNN